MKCRTILLVEDNQAHVRLIREAFRESQLLHETIAVKDGIEAMAYLRREGQYADVLLPDAILLDLNLPRKDGREVLAELKSDPTLRHIPVLVLTTSGNEQDVRDSYDLHANCYIKKPQNLRQLLSIVDRIQQFWLETVTLPSDRIDRAI
ncbi:response regulator [Leptolyngbya valderiana BDU 20041]|nr:response regulator [Geitlerinema sp. CS-897]OAB61499.1 response regulator [Leptolyngbya valderiana BDU 20041]PPT05436.1 Two-component system response regulator [Geitlerinema sp. FC II]